MSIPSKQIGWSNESNLLSQICKQLERLTRTVAATAGGGILNPSAGFIPFNAGLSFQDSFLYQDAEASTLSTIYSGTNTGLKLDFTNNFFVLGKTQYDGVAVFVDCLNNRIFVGDYDNFNNNTYLRVDDDISTVTLGGVVGDILRTDGIAKFIEFGDLNGNTIQQNSGSFNFADNNPNILMLGAGGPATRGSSPARFEFGRLTAYDPDTYPYQDGKLSIWIPRGEFNSDYLIDCTPETGFSVNSSNPDIPGGPGTTNFSVSEGSIDLSITGVGTTVQFYMGLNAGGTIPRYSFANVPVFATNAAALLGGMTGGDIYRNGDVLQIVH